MNLEIILSSIGQVLMEGRDNTPLGVSEEKDFHDFHESLQYFHLEWLKKEIGRICRRHTIKKTFLINDLFL